MEAIAKDDGQRDATASEIAVTAAGMTLAVELLLARYVLIATNVPYLGRRGQDAVLSEFAARRFPDAKADLATIFLARLLDLLASGATAAVVTPQNWQFLTSYTHFRTHLLRAKEWNLDARLGPGAFLTISGEVVNVALVAMSRSDPHPHHSFFALDVTNETTPQRKAAALAGSQQRANSATFEGLLSQREQVKNPDAIVVLGRYQGGPRLGQYAFAVQGLITGDYSRFGRCFWEVVFPSDVWAEYLGAVTTAIEFGGCEHVVRWEGGDGDLAASDGARIQGLEALGKAGVSLAQMGGLAATRFGGSLFDNTTAVLIPRETAHLPAIWSFCKGGALYREVRCLNPKLNVDVGYLEKVPFDLAHWERVAAGLYPNGLPAPWSLDPTQWIFHGHPARSTAPLQAAVARLLGYRWPAELDATMQLSAEARTWVKRSAELVEFADRDGIVCLSSLRNEEPAALRLRGLLSAAFGKEWTAAKELELLAETPGRASNLEEWLRDRFFGEHCSLFHQRPFIWHLCDGRNDGFHALVNYHRLAEGNGKGRQFLDKLTYDYLGEWIDRQRRDASAGETGAEARLSAAIELQGQLKKILEGEKPYDIFVRWKPLHRQPIGWEPDIDDGVRLNARPFLTATLSAGRAGAGLFRAKPNIHWKKDRGAEPQRDRADFPWFYGSDGKFHGERHNDLHLSLDEKRRAREAKAKGGAKR